MESTSRIRWTDALLIGGVALLGLAASAHLALAPRDPAAPVAVIFAPGTPAGEAFAAVAEAGARVLKAGPFANIVVAVPDDAGFPARASAHGAWLVADANRIPGCSVATP